MHAVTPDTPLEEIFGFSEFSGMQGQFIASGSDWFTGAKSTWTLRDIQREQPTWDPQDMADGLNRLLAIARRNEPFVFSLAGGARLIAMPADRRSCDPACLLLAGGAYGAVCSMAEAFPVAARLNALGVDCWCLNYQTATVGSMTHGLMPQPLDDTAEAVRFLSKRCPGRSYVMAGFSAGGHVCSLWGTDHLGYGRYGLPQPEALLLAYPLTSLNAIPSGPVKDFMLQGLFGTGHNQQQTDQYSAPGHIGPAYPPTWILRASDDSTIPEKDTEAMITSLEKENVLCHLETVAFGGHGFGLGSQTAASGWVDRAWSWANEIYLKRGMHPDG